MRNYYTIILTAIITLLHFNCTSSDEGTIDIENPPITIVGTWEIVSFKINGIESLDNILMDEDGCPFEFVFTATHSQVLKFNGPDCTLFEERTPKNYCLNDSTLIFDCIQGGENVSVEVLELTQTTLKYFEVNSLGEIERTLMRL